MSLKIFIIGSDMMKSELNAARGIVNALILGLGFWLLIILSWWK